MRTAVRRLTAAPALSAWDVLLPLHRAWWALCGVPMLATLHWLVGLLGAYPVTLAVGPFGLAVIGLTLVVRLVLLPLAVWQVRQSVRAHRTAAELRARLQPRVAALRRRHRGRPDAFRKAVSEAVRTEGAGPLGAAGGGLGAGILGAAVQAPVLIALYWVILGVAHGPTANLHFLWIVSLALPDPVLLPVVAGLTTYLVTRLAARSAPPPPYDDEQTAAASRATTLAYPLVLTVSAHFAPAALVLYWVTGNLVAAAQQWVVGRLVARSHPAIVQA